MTRHSDLGARPTADWISRYASGLLGSDPRLHPLDAVRMAMNASAVTGEERPRQPAAAKSLARSVPR